MATIRFYLALAWIHLRYYFAVFVVVILFPFRLIQNVAYELTIEAKDAENEILRNGYAARGEKIGRLESELSTERELHGECQKQLIFTRALAEDAEGKLGTEIERLETKLFETEEALKLARSTIKIQDEELKLLAGVNARNLERVHAEISKASRVIAAMKHAGEEDLIGAGPAE